MASSTQANDNREVEERYKKGGLRAVQTFAKDMKESWEKVSVKIGVTGTSGVGKSSFINAYRGIKDADEEGAAEVGVTQTTMQAIPYPDPNNPKIVLYDLPGVGTPEFPQYTYLEDPKIGLKNYDFIIIMTATRFTENDLWLYKKMKEMEKPAFLVRTKVLMDIENMKKSKRAYKDKKIEDIINEVEGKYKDEMRNGKLLDNERVYFIDSYEPEHTRLDFSTLIKDIIKKVSFNKGEAIIYSLKIHTPQLINEKVTFLDKRRKWVALISGGAALLPIPGVSMKIDMGIITEEAAFYRKQLDIDGAIANDLNIANAAVTRITETSNEITSDWIKSIAQSEEARNVEKFGIPGLGRIFSVFVSARNTYFMLGKILQKMKEDALKVHTLLIDDLAIKQNLKSNM